MMSQSQYSLTWEAHVRNVCDGLCTLQQNGEFVDMTLAADGHMVKVHQVVLALASPYFKDLIMSAQCPHPVIFLNKVTHSTLAAILEYIYTGEVLVTLEHLNDLIEAAKDLHIKGLKDMKVHPALMETSKGLAMEEPSADILQDNELCLFQVTQEDDSLKGEVQQQDDGMNNMIHFTSQCAYDDEQLCERTMEQDINDEQFLRNGVDMQAVDGMENAQDEQGADHMQTEQIINEMPNENVQQNISEQEMLEDNTSCNYSSDNNKSKFEPGSTALQYTVSNQGSLQMILNRFVYYLKHTNRDNSRQWRCVDYLSHVAKCPAHVITKDDIVTQRVDMHTHPFHDKRILKKLKTGSVFSAIVMAEKEGMLKKKKTEDPILDNDSDESRIE